MTDRPQEVRETGPASTESHERPESDQRGLPASQTLRNDLSPYCTGCAHDWSRHRSGRCWTGPLGEPLYRTRSLITCMCTDERTKP